MNLAPTLVPFAIPGCRALHAGGAAAAWRGAMEKEGGRANALPRWVSSVALLTEGSLSLRAGPLLGRTLTQLVNAGAEPGGAFEDHSPRGTPTASASAPFGTGAGHGGDRSVRSPGRRSALWSVPGEAPQSSSATPVGPRPRRAPVARGTGIAQPQSRAVGADAGTAESIPAVDASPTDRSRPGANRWLGAVSRRAAAPLIRLEPPPNRVPEADRPEGPTWVRALLDTIEERVQAPALRREVLDRFIAPNRSGRKPSALAPEPSSGDRRRSRGYPTGPPRARARSASGAPDAIGAVPSAGPLQAAMGTLPPRSGPGALQVRPDETWAPSSDGSSAEQQHLHADGQSTGAGWLGAEVVLGALLPPPPGQDLRGRKHVAAGSGNRFQAFGLSVVPPGTPSEDELTDLAAKVGQILREEARRYGIDV
jgi:hypothetical protein